MKKLISSATIVSLGLCGLALPAFGKAAGASGCDLSRQASGIASGIQETVSPAQDAVSRLAAGSSACRFNSNSDVAHFPQFHWRPEFQGDSKVLERVARSQFSLSQFIKANPDRSVFVEGLYEDAGPEKFTELARDPGSFVAASRTIFPSGIPSRFEELSDLQKQFLAEVGAPYVLYYLGELGKIRKTLQKNESEVIDAGIARRVEKLSKLSAAAVLSDPELQRLILSAREIAAAREVKSSGKKAILVFGGAHDFSPYFREEVSTVTGCAELPALPASRRGAGSMGGVTLFSEFHGDVSAAQVYYGGLKRQLPQTYKEALPAIEREQERLLEFLAASKMRIGVADWQHFVTPALKVRGLDYLDSASINDTTFSIEDFKRIIEKDPVLKGRGQEWLERH